MHGGLLPKVYESLHDFLQNKLWLRKLRNRAAAVKFAAMFRRTVLFYQGT
jgi:hypothetical protein